MESGRGNLPRAVRLAARAMQRLGFWTSAVEGLAVIGLALACTPADAADATRGPVVHVAYLVPRDREPISGYPDRLDRVMTEFADEPIGFCYDSGHENINRAGFRDLERYGRRLLTLHLHDNRGDDAHTLPYEGDTDWPRLMELLRGFGSFLTLFATMREGRLVTAVATIPVKVSDRSPNTAPTLQGEPERRDGTEE